MLKFSTNLDTWPTKDVQNLPWTHISVTQFILCMIFLMLVATIQHLNYSWQEPKQESKKHNLQLIFLTHLWLKQNLTLFMRLYICPHSLCDILSLSSSSLWCSMSALILLRYSISAHILLVTLYLCPHPLCDILSLPSPSLWRSISAFSSLRRWSSCMLDTMAGNFSSSWLLSRISLPIQSCNVLHASVTQPVNSPLVICI